MAASDRAIADAYALWAAINARIGKIQTHVSERRMDNIDE
jgi:hypothetical protein